MPIWNENSGEPRQNRRFRRDLARDNRENSARTFSRRSIQVEGYGDGDLADWEVREQDREYHNSLKRDAPQGRFHRPTVDDAIIRDVYQLLGSHRQIESQFIRVRARGGVVLLEGVVMHPRQRWIAEQLARTVAGVHDVENRLEVDF